MTVVGDVPVLRWPEIDALGVADAVVTTRHGGVSVGPYDSLNLGLHVGDDPASVIENRRRAAAAIGLGLDDLVFCNQTHSRTVAAVSIADRGSGALGTDTALPDTDATLTTEPGVGLVAMVADCVPIVLVDPVARVLSTVHAGWRGATQRIASAAVATMVESGADPSRIVAGLGPAVPASGYQVGRDVFDAAVAAFGTSAERIVVPDGTGRWTYDGWEANRTDLIDAGVDPARIHIAEVGTDSPDFFSDRAERPCGRFAVLARLLPE